MTCTAVLFTFVGTDYFPQIDAGEMTLDVRAAPGTRIEQAEKLFQQVEDTISQVVPRKEIGTIIDNIGLDEALVLNASGLQVAMVEPDGTVRFRDVSVYRDLGTTAELRQGLQGGESLILSPPTELADGSKVRIAHPHQPPNTASRTAHR